MSIATLPHAAQKEADPAIAAARRVLETEADALRKLSAFISTSFSEAVEMIAVADGRVIVTGMGKSGHVARKIAATLASTGTPSFFVHPAEASHGDMGMITRGDVVLALSNSGESREMQDIIRYTRRFAIPLISITSAPQSTLGTQADISLFLPDCPEACPNGLAPTTSTTLAMALGDALAIALLERNGFTAKDYKVFHPGGKLGQQLLCVAEIMHTGDALPLVTLSATVQKAVEVMNAKGFGCVGIIDDAGALAGIITDGDLRRHLSADLLERRAADIMTTRPRTTAPDTLVAEVVAQMNDIKGTFRKITVLFVTDADKKPAGILHIHDCLRAGFG